jgi:O-antigen/teichoic acid export membrane protein
VLVAPYRLGLRYDRAVAARYLRFSAPILLTVLGTVVIAQGQILVIKLHDGLAAAGFITLAITVTRYIDRADQIVTATIYPAICAIQGQRRALEELYVKSNQATLMWVAPYTVAIMLFAPDLVRYALGARWQPAVVLLQGLAIVGAITQLGFNWFSFFRAHGETGPPAVEGVAGALAFLALAPAGLLIDGFDGFVLGRIAAALVPMCVRGVFVRRLLPEVRYRQIVAPTLIPVGLAATAAVVVRVALWGGRRFLLQAIAELALFAVVYAATALRRERALLLELLGGLRRASGRPASGAGTAGGERAPVQLKGSHEN